MNGYRYLFIEEYEKLLKNIKEEIEKLDKHKGLIIATNTDNSYERGYVEGIEYAIKKLKKIIK